MRTQELVPGCMRVDWHWQWHKSVRMWCEGALRGRRACARRATHSCWGAACWGAALAAAHPRPCASQGGCESTAPRRPPEGALVRQRSRMATGPRSAAPHLAPPAKAPAAVRGLAASAPRIEVASPRRRQALTLPHTPRPRRGAWRARARARRTPAPPRAQPLPPPAPGAPPAPAGPGCSVSSQAVNGGVAPEQPPLLSVYTLPGNKCFVDPALAHIGGCLLEQECRPGSHRAALVAKPASHTCRPYC